MPKAVRLIAIGVGIAFLGFVIFNYAGYGINLGSSGHFIENISPSGYPGISEMPLYEGDSPPEKIPNYENDVEITPAEPNE